MGFDVEYFTLTIIPITLQAGLIWLFRWRLAYGLFNVFKDIKLDELFVSHALVSTSLLLLVLYLFGQFSIIVLLLLSIPDTNINKSSNCETK